MTPNRHGRFNSLVKRWLGLHNPAPSPVTNDEIFHAIQYLDPEPEELGLTEDLAVFLAIQDLDPDFN